MKPTFLIFIFAILFSLSSQAQTQQGTLLIGGNGSFTHENGVGLTLLPNLGYFVANNLVLGTSLEFKYFDTEFINYWSAGVQPFARYYFGEEAKTRFFGQLSGGISRTKQFITFYDPNVPNFDTDFVFKNNYFGAGVGMAHFITETVALEIQAAYHSTQIGISPRQNKYGLFFGVQIHLPDYSY